ncbi:AraC family transcriptional regulator [Lactiplantibacillus paraplantarum]|uniref:AraC family transcriptional regulator n=1 Tax=Lactiplantibacillus paraplantarum TaxID=60520 RepID=A0A4Q9Y047_9LACO|nr:AraC family transcriptional regulator [Lactiplantibacillus paraplantarum]
MANKVGYEDPHYFSRLFRKKTGLSPVQFREQYQK